MIAKPRGKTLGQVAYEAFYGDSVCAENARTANPHGARPWRKSANREYWERAAAAVLDATVDDKNTYRVVRSS